MYNKLCGLAAVCALLAAGPAAAQFPDVHVEPYVGIFVPLNQIADADVLGFTFQVDQQEALAVGGRATIFPRERWGLQANFMYAFSNADVKFGSSALREETASVWALDGRVVYNLMPDPVDLLVSGGVGVISHGDDAYQNVTNGETDFMGVLGAGLRFGWIEGLVFRLDVDSYLYYARPTVASSDFKAQLQLNSEFQTDLVLSGGLQFTLEP